VARQEFSLPVGEEGVKKAKASNSVLQSSELLLTLLNDELFLCEGTVGSPIILFEEKRRGGSMMNTRLWVGTTKSKPPKSKAISVEQRCTGLRTSWGYLKRSVRRIGRRRNREGGSDIVVPSEVEVLTDEGLFTCNDRNP